MNNYKLIIVDDILATENVIWDSAPTFFWVGYGLRVFLYANVHFSLVRLTYLSEQPSTTCMIQCTAKFFIKLVFYLYLCKHDTNEMTTLT
jgi:hypothetical protein